MGWVATPELVAAVSNAGGFGFLAGATIRPEDIDAAIEKTRALTAKPFGVNFLMDAPGADVIADFKDTTTENDLIEFSADLFATFADIQAVSTDAPRNRGIEGICSRKPVPGQKRSTKAR